MLNPAQLLSMPGPVTGAQPAEFKLWLSTDFTPEGPLVKWEGTSPERGGVAHFRDAETEAWEDSRVSFTGGSEYPL